MGNSRQGSAPLRRVACGVVLILELSLGSGLAAADDDVQLRAEAPVGLRFPVGRGPTAADLAGGPGTLVFGFPNGSVPDLYRRSGPLESAALRSQRVYARRRPSVLPVLAGVAAGYATAAIASRHSDSAETIVGAGVVAGVSVGILVGFLLK